MAAAFSDFQFEIRAASPIVLPGEDLPRTDANSPVHRHDGRVFAFMSHYLPLGHTYRRMGTRLDDVSGPLESVRLLDDPNPAVGKWIESTWRAPSGRLYGWYHAEEVAPCERRLFLPHLGALVSDDDGASWHCLGEILRAPAGALGCDYRNGFLAGGYGDCCVIPDRKGEFLYLFFSSYVSDPGAQGIAVARYHIAHCDAPAPHMHVWRNGAWRPAADGLPAPIHPVARGWREPDPDAFWGPAVHFNREIDAYVMLLNRTRDGNSNMVQEGVYISFNERIEDSAGWTVPRCAIRGGVWYPEIVGLGPADGDTLAGSPARLFMSGFSAWEIGFSRGVAAAAAPATISVDRETWTRLFGANTPARLGIG